MKSRVAMLIGASVIVIAVLFSMRDGRPQRPATTTSAVGFTGVLNTIRDCYDPAPMHYAGVGGLIWLAIAVLRRKPDSRRHTRIALPRATRKFRPDAEIEPFLPTINPS